MLILYAVWNKTAKILLIQL